MMARLLDMPWLRAHTEKYQTDPESAHDWDATPVGGGTGLVPTLLLTTIGRKSGMPLSTPLLYQPTGAGFMVVASRGGSETHPHWYRNLLIESKCNLQVGKFRYSAIARTLDSHERPAYWEWMVRFWPDYERYQSRTSREIPVVVLDAKPVM